MGEERCLEMFLDFFKNADSVKILDIILDIYDQIKSREIDRNISKKKFLKVLYNLKQSQTIDSLLEKKDKMLLNSFLTDFLQINSSSGEFYIGNRRLCQLSFEEFINLLMKVKYLKVKELQQEEAVN